MSDDAAQVTGEAYRELVAKLVDEWLAEDEEARAENDAIEAAVRETRERISGLSKDAGTLHAANLGLCR